MTPDQLKALFDGMAIIIMFVWGLLVKYQPLLAKVPNTLIPWFNAIGYILTRLVGAGTASAAGLTPDQGHAVLDIGGIILASFTNAVWARQLYEGFGRGILEGLFHWKKAQ